MAKPSKRWFEKPPDAQSKVLLINDKDVLNISAGRTGGQQREDPRSKKRPK